jgi:uncharacterized protein DUF4129
MRRLIFALLCLVTGLCFAGYLPADAQKRFPTESSPFIGTVLAELVRTLSAYSGPNLQSSTLDEGEFWALLERTNSLLQQATTSPAQQAAAAQIHTWWTPVTAVRVKGAPVSVDMTWLSQVTPETLTLAQSRVQVLLDYHRRALSGSGGASSGGASASALNDVLKDPRFHYPDVTPPPPDLHPPSIGQIDPRLSQFMLILVGSLLAAVVIGYVARNLRVQRAAVETGETPGDDPTTSADATQRASDFEAAQDYRSAIRYQYLSSLLLLDERGLIHYDRTLTNREHLSQVSGKPQLVSLLQPVVNAFDDVWYGFMPVDEAFYRQYCQNVERLRQIVRRR